MSNVTMTVGTSSCSVASVEWRRTEANRRFLTVGVVPTTSGAEHRVMLTLLTAYFGTRVVPTIGFEGRPPGADPPLRFRLRCTNLVVSDVRHSLVSGGEEMWTLTLDATQIFVTGFDSNNVSTREVAL